MKNCPEYKNVNSKMSIQRITALCILLVVVFVLYGRTVPYGNEYLYLLRLYQTYHPGFLANDWTFASGAPEHFIFNHFFGILPLFLPIEVVGWIGRFLCWFSLLFLLIRLGGYYNLKPFISALAIATWLGLGQSLIGGSWMIKGFEAKCVSYILLMASIILYLEKREAFSAVTLGLAFSFHPSVGMWGSVAVISAKLADRKAMKKLIQYVTITVIFALPGVIPLLPHIFLGSTATIADWKFLALVNMPAHLDPFSWPLRNELSLLICFIVNGIYFWHNWQNNFIRFISSFQLVIFLIFILGIVLRWLENYTLLQYFPFRLFPLFTPLFFLFATLSMLESIRTKVEYKYLFYVAILGLLCLPNPITGIMDQISSSRKAAVQDELTQVFKWAAENIPEHAKGIMPPWRRDSWHFSKHAQLVSYVAPVYQNLPEWRKRIALVAGELFPGNYRKEIVHNYENLTKRELLQVKKKYEANYLVTRSRYSFPELFNYGEYRIYWLDERLPNENFKQSL